jgi:hypothetical protein
VVTIDNVRDETVNEVMKIALSAIMRATDTVIVMPKDEISLTLGVLEEVFSHGMSGMRAGGHGDFETRYATLRLAHPDTIFVGAVAHEAHLFVEMPDEQMFSLYCCLPDGAKVVKYYEDV